VRRDLPTVILTILDMLNGERFLVLKAARPRFAGPRMVAVTLLVMTAAFGLNFGAGVFLAPLTAERGWGVGVLSAAATLSTLVGALMTPVVGLLLDRIGPRRVVTGSIALLAGSYLLLAVSDQLWQFLLVYPLLGGTGFAGSATLANSVLIARWYCRARATMLGRTTLGITLGQVVVLPLAALLVGRFGTTIAYLVLGAVVLVAVVPVAGLLLPTTRRSSASTPTDRRRRTRRTRHRTSRRPACSPAGSGGAWPASGCTPSPSTRWCCTFHATPPVSAGASRRAPGRWRWPPRSAG
jgi:MFS family permease